MLAIIDVSLVPVPLGSVADGLVERALRDLPAGELPGRLPNVHLIGQVCGKVSCGVVVLDLTTAEPLGRVRDASDEAVHARPVRPITAATLQAGEITEHLAAQSGRSVSRGGTRAVP